MKYLYYLLFCLSCLAVLVGAALLVVWQVKTFDIVYTMRERVIGTAPASFGLGVGIVGALWSRIQLNKLK